MEVDTCFRRAAAFLASATPADVLGTVLPNSPRLEEAVGLVQAVDHVGFLVPACEPAALTSAARRAGFDGGTRSFPSEILTRELGELAGTGTVATTIFHARGQAENGTTMLAEAFMTHDAPTDVVADWIRRGVGSHVALAVSGCGDLVDVVNLMKDEGCQMPAFMNGEPLHNAGEKLTVVYFDGRANGRSVRLELCHRA